MLSTSTLAVTDEDSLETQARRLANEHRTVRQSRRRPVLLARLNLCEQRLREAYRFFAAAPPEVQARSRAAEWLMDNFYLLERTVRQIREAMPPGYYRRLPELTQTALRGYPRVYAIASALAAEGQERLDLAQAERFLIAYQETTPLTIGELWALPTMLRLILIELLDRMFRALLAEPRSAASLPAAVEAEVVVANCFLGLQVLERQDWKVFFEAVSRVEAILRRDPAGVYARMDRETRDRYRHVVEALARAVENPRRKLPRRRFAWRRRRMSGKWRRDRERRAPFMLAITCSNRKGASAWRPAWVIFPPCGLVGCADCVNVPFPCTWEGLLS